MLEDRWVRCPHCGHKLFKDKGGASLEIKCSSCKSIVTIVDSIAVGCKHEEKDVR